MKCDRATIAPDGDNDIIIALSLRCSGYWAQIGGPGGSKRSQGAEIKWATIVTEERPRQDPRCVLSIVINLPALNQHQSYTYLDVSILIRERLQRLVEQYLPGLLGPRASAILREAPDDSQREREPITVWVECRAFTRDPKGYAWRWVPGEPGSGKAFKLVVPPGGTKRLEDELSLKLPKIATGNPLKGGNPIFSTSSTVLHVPFEASRIRIWAEVRA